MTGFFKKLLGKKDEKVTPQDDGGSWTDHEISVETSSDAESPVVSDEPDLQIDTQIEPQVNAQVNSLSETVQALPNDDVPLGDTQPLETKSEEDFENMASGMVAAGISNNETTKIPAVDIATLDTADLKFAMDQVEPQKVIDPLDEITAQIQAELAAEKSEKEKKETLEKLIEVTNQLRRPDFDEDFDV